MVDAMKTLVVSAMLVSSSLMAELPFPEETLIAAPQQNVTLKLSSRTGLTENQTSQYSVMFSEIDLALADQLKGTADKEEKKYWLKKIRSFKNTWKQILSLQAKINLAGNALEKERSKNQKNYKSSNLEALRPLVASLIQNWNGERKLLSESQVDDFISPIETADWVWETSPVIKSMIMGYVRN